MNKTNNLLVDIGNTRLKWATANGPDINPGESLLNTKVNSKVLIQLWQDIELSGQIVIACVGSQQLADQVSKTANELWPGIKASFAKSQAESFGVKNAYKTPELLGVDRWLGMLAAYHRYQSALCVVGCGTAVTVDIVNAKGQHLGGLICPGLGLMKVSLAQNTQQLSLVEDIEYPKGLANCTGAAIHNGALLAVCGLIERVLSDQGRGLKLILTGGDAAVIAPALKIPAAIDPNLVLSGLALTVTPS